MRALSTELRYQANYELRGLTALPVAFGPSMSVTAVSPPAACQESEF